MGSAHDLRRSDNPICTYTLRCLLWVCKLNAACNGVWRFITKALTPPHLPHKFVRGRISTLERLEPLLHRFVSQLRHTHHRYFIDPRHIGCTTHLWAAFHISITPCLGSSLPTSPGFRHNLLSYACWSIREGVSGRYPVIPPFGLSVLLRSFNFLIADIDFLPFEWYNLNIIFNKGGYKYG